MAKKQVRISEKALDLAKQQLRIPANTNATADELVSMLIMQGQDNRKEAQEVLDYMGDEFMQKVDGQNKPRLISKKGHLVENGQALGLDRLLIEMDRKPDGATLSDLKQSIEELRVENAKEHRRQANMFNVAFHSLKLMTAHLLHIQKPQDGAADIVADVALSETTKGVLKGIDEQSYQVIKEKSAQKTKKSRGYYRD